MNNTDTDCCSRNTFMFPITETTYKNVCEWANFNTTWAVWNMIKDSKIEGFRQKLVFHSVTIHNQSAQLRKGTHARENPASRTHPSRTSKTPSRMKKPPRNKPKLTSDTTLLGSYLTHFPADHILWFSSGASCWGRASLTRPETMR